ncbi:hypothetical protein SPI_00117 [Niveomyces insectorum RCEF 264]|uniref:Uncharacterized protein n=1 Tax=Niveomyces insectorum RCEF 264 TaxID=1081102 RepID=A0A162JEY7_9HYPO|nr:hypothetical protein SPI_00117 [Niveomyces insectorum RCEF 264]
MCVDAIAEYRCSDYHEALGQRRCRFVGFIPCDRALQLHIMCRNRPMVIHHEFDDLSVDCPVCRGETPPESP